MVINQNVDQGAFLPIGTVILDEGENLAIILRDIVTNEASGANVVFDALRMTANTTAEIDLVGSSIKTSGYMEIGNAYPNPFNSSIVIDYELKRLDELNVFSDLFIDEIDSIEILDTTNIILDTLNSMIRDNDE